MVCLPGPDTEQHFDVAARMIDAVCGDYERAVSGRSHARSPRFFPGAAGGETRDKRGAPGKYGATVDELSVILAVHVCLIT